MAAILVTAAASFHLIVGVLSENPQLFIACVLFFCTGLLLFDLWKQNPHRLV
jgi:hypothetical protein